MIQHYPVPTCDPRYDDVGYDTIRVNGEALATLLRRVEYGSVQFKRGGAIGGRMHLFGKSQNCPTFMVQMIGIPDNLHTLNVTVVFGNRAYNVAAVKLAASVLAWVECGGRDVDALILPENEGKGQSIVDWLTLVIKTLAWDTASTAKAFFGDRVYHAEYVNVEASATGVGVGSLTVSISPRIGSDPAGSDPVGNSAIPA